MKILLTVIGSNQFLIQDHTVGKKEGAPMIYFGITISIQDMGAKTTRGREGHTNMRSRVSG